MCDGFQRGEVDDLNGWMLIADEEMIVEHIEASKSTVAINCHIEHNLKINDIKFRNIKRGCETIHQEEVIRI